MTTSPKNWPNDVQDEITAVVKNAQLSETSDGYLSEAELKFFIQEMADLFEGMTANQAHGVCMFTLCLKMGAGAPFITLIDAALEGRGGGK